MQTRLRYFETLIDNGLIGNEEQYQVLTDVAIGLRVSSTVMEGVGQGISLIPDLFAGFPTTQIWIPLGTKLGGVFSTIARILNTVADVNNLNASLRQTQGSWERREDEWQHQVEVLNIEIQQIERQILAADRRRDTALRELNNHQRQIENSAEIHDFLRDKFTNHALYLWLRQETAALYYRMYELALHTARQAQLAYNYECGHTQRNFLSADMWDNLHEGILAGERLQLALRQMEKAYLDKNRREYELTKHISLRHHFPLDFLQLLIIGRCEIEIPEWMFDQNYPGHYMRRIKNVTLTLPAVAGPYTGIHCRLTLLSSITRVDPYLIEPPADCCDDETPGNSYEPQPDDPRIVKQYCATEAIATSSGQNDAGMFELNFRDERYLPFEYDGAVSCWRIELPHESNYFDIESLSDVILHLNYMACEGGEVLGHAAKAVAQPKLPGDGWRLFQIDQEFPQAWHQFESDTSDGKLDLKLTRNMFPFIPGQPDLQVNKWMLFFEAPGAEPSAHHIIEFLAGNSEDYAEISKEWSKCDLAYIPCIATAEWPKLFIGVHIAPLGSWGSEDKLSLGTFRFPQDTKPIKRAYLAVSYDVA